MNPVFTIFLGDKKTMNLKVVDDDCNGGGPIDLTYCTEINVSLPNQDGTIKHLTRGGAEVSITAPAVLGKFSVPITSVVSALLNVGELQNVDVTLTISGEKTTVRFERALSVFEFR